jgi:hypothetical protein
MFTERVDIRIFSLVRVFFSPRVVCK